MLQNGSKSTNFSVFAAHKDHRKHLDSQLMYHLSKYNDRGVFPIIVIADGARSIRKRLTELVGNNLIFILDWYDLSDKIWQYMSQIARNKSQKEEDSKVILAMLWSGQVNESIAYLQTNIIGKNELKIAFRNLWKNKTYLFINLIGLSVAFGISTLLFLTAYDLLTFDQFHEQNGPVYRVYQKINEAQGEQYGNSMPLPMRGALKAEFPEVKLAVRVLDGGVQILKEDKLINEGITFTDSDFFQVFGYKLLKGNSTTALKELSNVVVREDVAKNLFGEQDPMGKTITVSHGDKQQYYIVSGILEKGPDNTSIDHEMLVRIENVGEYNNNKDRWDANQHTLYIKLDEKTTATAFEKRLKSFTAKYYKGNIAQLKKEGAKPDDRGEVISTRIMGLSESHFDTKVGGRNQAINKVYPYTLLIVGIIILLIAAINFINLSSFSI